MIWETNLSLRGETVEIYFDLVRYGHIFSGITWIGLLYYFNFVQVPSFAQMDAAARSNAIQFLVPRALLWFRWSALATVLFGLAFVFGAMSSDYIPDYVGSHRFKSILIGGTLGIIMAANVWFIIWPNQKKIIAAVTATAKEGTPAPAEQPRWARKALLASRTNTMLSFPMLFFMAGAIHLPSLWE
jgi:uncharacterized membrane protein